MSAFPTAYFLRPYVESNIYTNRVTSADMFEIIALVAIIALIWLFGKRAPGPRVDKEQMSSNNSRAETISIEAVPMVAECSEDSAKLIGAVREAPKKRRVRFCSSRHERLYDFANDVVVSDSVVVVKK